MNIKFFLTLLTILIFTLPVYAVPGIPHRFYGTVDFSNAPAPDNFSVSAKINDAGVASTTVLNGRYGYEGELFFITDPYNNRARKTVEFFVNGIKANETAIFQNGGSQRLDLTVNALANGLTADEAIENKTISIGPDSLFTIDFGEDLDIIISSSTETTATIEEINELSESFFAEHHSPDLNVVRGYEIKINGSVSASIIIHYEDNSAGIEEDSIAPYKFNGTNWEKIEPFTLNKITKTISFTITNAATPYAIMGSPEAEETDPCEGIGCNDSNPCTIDECNEGTCIYTTLADGAGCPIGVCNAGACETIEEQREQPVQIEEEETQQTPPPEGSEQEEKIQETKSKEIIEEEEEPEAAAGETAEETEGTKEQEEIKTPTGLFTLEVTPSTIITAFGVMILTFIASYLLFRKR